MDKRSILAIILIGLILVLYGPYARWINPPKPHVSADSTQSEAIGEERPARPAPSEPGVIAPAGGADAIDMADIISSDTLQKIIPNRTALIETERYLMRISSDGAQIKSLILKPYNHYQRDSVELIPDEPGARPGYRFWTYNGPIETAALTFQFEDDPGEDDVRITLAGGQTDTLRLLALLESGKGIRISYVFYGDKFTCLIAAEGVGSDKLFVRDYCEALWTGGLAYTESDTDQDQSFSEATIYFAGDETQKQKIESKKSISTNPASGETRWGAIRTKYYMAALLPETSPAVGSWLESVHDSMRVSKVQPNRLGVALRIPIVKGSPVTPVRLFTGPLDLRVLKEVDPSLASTMNWGWPVIAFFSKAVLWGLMQIYALVPNYGVVIIVFSIIIRLIIWPLTHKSAVSMAGMQRLQPQLVILREKFKNDPQRLNKEMMKLYKEEKINPMGGCLPMLLQLPLLYGLFIVFRSTIEFRQAPFALWINDLSKPDIIFHLPFSIPIYGDYVCVLPILMAVSTFFQSKMTMSDPNQKMMLYIMPIMLLLFFNSFPSGYNLYFTLFNVWQVVQQKITPIPTAGSVKPS